jgi:hypothetical protein
MMDDPNEMQRFLQECFSQFQERFPNQPGLFFAETEDDFFMVSNLTAEGLNHMIERAKKIMNDEMQVTPHHLTRQ